MLNRLIAALLALAPAGVPAPAVDVPPSLGREYTKPHQLIDVGGGRKINLHCMGSGSPTVLFDSGLSDWSNTWVLIQPKIAQSVRACSYDRAGMGFSDPSPFARSPRAIVGDIRALKTAAIAGPMVLVGHSLGGFNAKLYTALYPDDVAGLVLVDPSEERMYERVRDKLRAKYGLLMASRLELADYDLLKFLTAKFEKCAAIAAKADLDPASADYRGCTDPVRSQLGPDIVAARPNIQKTSTYQATQASELLNSIYANRSGDAVYAALFKRHSFGNKPMVVLTSDRYDRKDPEAVADHFVITTAHGESASLSRRGIRRTVADTGHNIQVERPQAIIDAINEVLSALRRG